jgi:hypothetical protein
MLRFFSTFLLIVIGMMACKDVQPGNLNGTWVMNDASRRILPDDLRQASPKLVLDPNGSFTVTEMPGLFYFPKRRPARLETGSGVWRLEVQEGRQMIQLNFHSIADWKQTDLPFGTQLNATKRWSTIVLYYYLGDPDSGRMIELEKQ